MSLARALRFLSIPAAVALGGTLAVACSDDTPTAPDQSMAGPSFKKGKPKGGQSWKIDDVNDSCDIYGGLYALTQVKPGSSADDDGDGLICQYIR